MFVNLQLFAVHFYPSSDRRKRRRRRALSLRQDVQSAEPIKRSINSASVSAHSVAHNCISTFASRAVRFSLQPCEQRTCAWKLMKLIDFLPSQATSDERGVSVWYVSQCECACETY